MKDFIEHVRKSIYGPDYYRELSAQPASFSWKYYFSLVLALSLLVAVVSSLPLVPVVNQTLREFPQRFLAYYPDDLEVRIVNGHATTTAVQPFYLPLPQTLKDIVASGTDMQYLGVIDVATPANIETFRNYHALFWVAESALMVRDQNGAIRVNPFDRGLNYTVNEKVLYALIEDVHPFFKFVAPVLVFMIFLGMIVAFLINLVYLIFPAFLVWLLGKMLKRQWTYGFSYRIALHATTLPLLLTTIVSFVGLNLGSLPFFTTFILIAVVWANFREGESASSVVTPADLS